MRQQASNSIQKHIIATYWSMLAFGLKNPSNLLFRAYGEKSTANSRWSTRKSSFTQGTIKCGFRDFGSLMIYKLETQKKESQHLQQFWFKKEHVFVVDLKTEASGKHRPLNMAQWHQNTSICFLATNSFPATKRSSQPLRLEAGHAKHWKPGLLVSFQFFPFLDDSDMKITVQSRYH